MKLINKNIKALILLFSLLPFSAQSFLPPNSLFGKVVNRVNTKEKIVALTFDDGPNNVYTTEILDILRTRGVKATFFLTGRNIAGNEILLRRMQVEGHSVGNHGFSHNRLDLINPLRIKGEVEETQFEIEEVVGLDSHLFRAPYGFYNSPFLINYLTNNGYSIIGWSVDPQDWKERDSEKIINTVINNVKPGDIILFHDGPEDLGKKGLVDRKATVEALPTIIEELELQGYDLVTVPELLMLEEKVLGEKSQRRCLWIFCK